MPDWTTAEWTSVLATLFAAVATGAALTATLLQLRVTRRARLPHLTGAVVGYVDGTAEVRIANSGPGLAVQVGFLIVDGEKLSTGLIGRGFLQPGEEGTRPIPRPQHDASVPGVFMCRDVDDNLHVWAHKGDYRRVSRRDVLRRRNVDSRGHFHWFYPDVPIPDAKGTTTAPPYEG